jgi:c-di-GMP-binding flagellar brake protein YcgR
MPSLDHIFGLGLTISLEYDEGSTTQFMLSRVEEVEPDCLWVAMPMRAAMFVPLPIGTPVIVHIKREDAVYTLHTRVSGRRLQPAPMLELRATGEVQRRQQREYARLRITLIPTSAAVIEADGSERRLAATIVNLSAGGVFLRTRQSIEVGQRVRLAVDLPTPGGPITGLVEVLRVDVRRAERGRFVEAGCAFLDLSDHDRDLVTKFIFRFQTRPPRSGAGDAP